MALDVTSRVYFALGGQDQRNPYPVDDPRFELFRRELARVHFLDQEARELFAVYGMDEATLSRRLHVDPGPVQSVEVLVCALREQRERAQAADACEMPGAAAACWAELH